jgi:regulator of cell morphogenesis and NO signaling
MTMTIDPPAHEPSTCEEWRTASCKDLVAHILEHHHGYGRKALAQLEEHLHQAVLEQGGRPSALGQVTVFFRELQLDLLAHFRMEEEQLFPAILAMASGGPAPEALATPAAMLATIEAEHQAVEELFINIRLVTGDYSPAAEAGPGQTALYLGLSALEDDLHRHLYLENHLLFPQVLPPGSL